MSELTIGRYPGARPFADNPSDQRLFYGREEEINLLFHRICATRLLVLFGKSGLGKTSLLQAGVYPKLRERNMLPIPIRLNIQESPLAIIKASISDADKMRGLDYTPGEGNTLWEFFKTAMFWQGEILLTPVLVFDQFEEIFTLKTAEERANLACALGDLFRGIAPPTVRQKYQTTAATDKKSAESSNPQLDQPPTVHVILSLREDFLGALQELAADIPGIFDDRVRLSPLSDRHAEQAIRTPASLNDINTSQEQNHLPTGQDAKHPATPSANLQFTTPPFTYAEDALAEILAYLRGKSGIIEPFQLQLVCRDIEEQVVQQYANGKPLTLITLKDLGGKKRLDNIIKHFYQQTLAKLSWRDRRHARRLCEEGLLNADGFRLPLQEQEIVKTYRINPPCLATLVEARLLHKEPRLESYFYELSHDSLSKPILETRRLKLSRKQLKVVYSGVALLVLLIIFAYWQAEAKKQAEAAKDQAQQARAAAEKVLDYLVFDLLPNQLEPMGRLDIVEQVQRRINNYYEKMGMEGQSTDVLNRRGAAFCKEGDRLFTQGKLTQAQASYQNYLAIAKQNQVLEPNKPTWPLSESVALDRLGDVLFDQGKLDDALKRYQASQSIRQKLAAQDPSNTQWQRSISVNLNKVGDILYAQGKRDEALKLYQESLSIRQKLAAQDPSNTQWQRDVSIALEKFGNILNDQGKLDEALKLYQEELSIMQKLVAQDPTNTQWQRDIPIASEEVGNILNAQGKSDEALKRYQENLSIFKKLAAQDPSNTQWQRDVSLALNKVGDVLIAQGKPVEALKHYQDGLSIMQKLTTQDPSNTEWQWDVSKALEDVGNILNAQGQPDDALKCYQDGLSIMQKLAAQDPSNATWKTDLSISYNNVMRLLSALKRDSEAAKLAEVRSAELLKQAETKENKQTLAGTYISLAWYELFNKNPQQALTASEKGLALNVDEITNATLNTNLAHAHLFLNQYEKAKTIYLANKTKKVADNRRFNQAVLDDFKAFRQRGINSADMKRIEVLMR